VWGVERRDKFGRWHGVLILWTRGKRETETVCQLNNAVKGKGKVSTQRPGTQVYRWKLTGKEGERGLSRSQTRRTEPTLVMTGELRVGRGNPNGARDGIRAKDVFTLVKIPTLVNKKKKKSDQRILAGAAKKSLLWSKKNRCRKMERVWKRRKGTAKTGPLGGGGGGGWGEGGGFPGNPNQRRGTGHRLQPGFEKKGPEPAPPR